MTKIQVPRGMLEAAMNADETSHPLTPEGIATTILQAALQWLSEHPIVPTDEQAKVLGDVFMRNTPEFNGSIKNMAVEWQRIMLLAPEPEVPEEVKDLLGLYGGEVGAAMNIAVLEAYRRGQRSKG